MASPWMNDLALLLVVVILLQASLGLLSQKNRGVKEKAKECSLLRPRLVIGVISLLQHSIGKESHMFKPRLEKWEKRLHPFIEVAINSHCKWHGYRD